MDDTNLENDIKKIEELLSKNNYSEAGELIKKVAASKFKDEENGAILTGFASAYIDICNSINSSYKNALEEAISSIKKVKLAEARSGDFAKIRQLKEDLKS